MSNEQNLIPNSERTPEELREIAAAGGRASGVSRRRKRSLREAADLYLSLPVSDKRAWNRLARDGVDPEDVDNQMAIIAGLTIKAIKGDAKAAKVLFDLLPEQSGQVAADQLEDDPITKSLKEEADGLF
nr:MAG TPA: hypothetical protein [Caudoviricetes sp.]